MALEAKVKDGSRVLHVTAFGGHSYIKGNGWVGVPAGAEDEARRHPMLDVREVEPAPEPAPEGQPATVAAEGPDALPADVQAMLKGNVGQVVAGLQAINDPELLQRIHDLDGRKGVKNAAKARMVVLREGDQAPKAKDDEPAKDEKSGKKAG